MIHSLSPPTPLPPAGEESERFPLKGLGVLVTRPEHQAGPLCQWIEQHGGVAIRCPALIIGEPHDWTPALAVFDRLATYDLAIFTSANAVDRALPLIQARGGFPSRLEIAAIGQATARMLKQRGVTHCTGDDVPHCESASGASGSKARSPPACGTPVAWSVSNG